VENYFNYFTEIEEHFQKRRGSILLLSTLDWALIETWKDSGIPLEAALRGIDTAFEHYESRRSMARKVNSLAYCSQEVLAAAEDMKEAVVGVASNGSKPAPFENAEIAGFLRRCSADLLAARLPEKSGISANEVAKDVASSLTTMALELEIKPNLPRLEDLERRLTVLEQKLFAVLLAAIPDDDLIAVHAEADRELAPYRHKMSGPQIEQLHKQYVHKRLLERYKLPRLSLFYM
jgi:hypothetical protein